MDQGLFLQQGVMVKDQLCCLQAGMLGPALGQRLSGLYSWKYLLSVIPWVRHRTLMEPYVGSRVKMWVSGVLEPFLQSLGQEAFPSPSLATRLLLALTVR